MSSFTKNAIKSSFLKLLEEKPLSQITVKMIVEDCGINRNSFYYHYADIPALMEEIAHDEADRIINDYPTVESIETALKATIDFVTTHRRSVMHIYNSVSRDIFERYQWKVCDYVITTYSKAALSGVEIDPSDKELVEHIYKSLLFGLSISWLDKRMDPTAGKKITRICELMHGMSDELIKRCRKDQ
ncbi:MAG: TetR/AcrR family transcriptional regulator C-terminal domain-containing protein [Firmicutes bacterium]|nr:TetR/AcrR family transcriptional regulator C-terminal domain-containing protein [Bacillota bacterium]